MKQAGPQLMAVRFEVAENADPLHLCIDDLEDRFFGRIEDLVKYWSEQGRLFAEVEGLAVSKDERANRLQAHAWNCFYDSRGIGRYDVVPV